MHVGQYKLWLLFQEHNVVFRREIHENAYNKITDTARKKEPYLPIYRIPW